MDCITLPTSSVLYYLHSDHLGSNTLTTDQSGNVVARQLYDAWGQVRGDLQTDIGYTRQREDVSINAMFYRARFYSPALGRFLSADTIVPEPGNPQSLNRYAYVRNRPLNYIDPSGHRETRCDHEGCSATQNDLDRAIGNAERARRTKFYRDCAQGGGAGCPNVPEILLSAFGGIAASALFAPEVIAKVVGVLCSIGARCVSGVVGSVTNMGGSVLGQWESAGKIDLLDVIGAGGAGFISGYVMPATATQAAFTYGVAGGGQQVASDLLHGRDVSPGLALLNAGLSSALGVRWGVYTPSKTLLQASTPEIWKAAHGSAVAAASLAFKDATNAWSYVPGVIKTFNVIRATVFSSISNGIPNLLANFGQ